MSLSEEEHELWVRFRRDGDAEARTFLFERYAPWSRRIAGNVFRRVRVPQMEWADFVQNASIGLLEAMDRFDPGRGVDFMAYAKLRVRGAAFNGVRAFLGSHDRDAAIVRFQQRLDHYEGDSGDALADFAGVVAGLAAGFLLEPAATDCDELQERVDATRLSKLLEEGLACLGAREREIIVAHYRHHVPFVELARHLGLTKGRISQIHSAAIGRLRQWLSSRRVDRSSYF